MNTKFLLFLGCAVVLMAVIRGTPPTPEERVNTAKSEAEGYVGLADKAQQGAEAANNKAKGYKASAETALLTDGLAQDVIDKYEEVKSVAETAQNEYDDAQKAHGTAQGELTKIQNIIDNSELDNAESPEAKGQLATDAENYAKEAKTQKSEAELDQQETERKANEAKTALNDANLMRAKAAQTKANTAATDANKALKEAQGFQTDVEDILKNVNAAIEAEECTGDDKTTAETLRNNITGADTAITGAITTDVEDANKTANDRAVEVTGIVNDMTTKITNEEVTDINKAAEADTKAGEAETAKNTVENARVTASQEKDKAASAETKVYGKCPNIKGPTVIPPGPTVINNGSEASTPSASGNMSDITTLAGNSSSNSSDRADSYGGEAVTANKWLMLCSTAALFALANFAF